MAGKMILFAVICFLLYWGWQYYKNAQTNKEKPKNPADFRDSDGDPDALRAYYERKIVEMEERAVMGIENAQEELEKYQEKLKKLNNLKNK